MPLPRTGNNQGTPTGAIKEPKLTRDLRRQYEAAEAVAYNGYKVENNPKLSKLDTDSGLRPNADPDYRIEGLVFDCYNPAPPILFRRRAELEAFALAAVDSEFDDVDFFADYIDADGFNWSDYINRKVKAAVLEGIRDGITAKVNARQAYAVVVNLTDLGGVVTPQEVGTMLNTRGVNHLKHVFTVAPAGLPQTVNVAVERISGLVIHHGEKGATTSREYAEDYAYSLYRPEHLDVQLVFDT